MNQPAASTLAAVAQMFAGNAERRHQRATTALQTLTRHERRILREAAVMGYVLGHRHGRVEASGIRADLGQPELEFPHDAAIVDQVIQHCDSTADLYPYLAAACNGRRRRITRYRLWPGE